MITAIAVVATAFAFGWLVGFVYGGKGLWRTLWRMTSQVVALEEEVARLRMEAATGITVLNTSMIDRLKRADFAPVEK